MTTQNKVTVARVRVGDTLKSEKYPDFEYRVLRKGGVRRKFELERVHPNGAVGRIEYLDGRQLTADGFTRVYRGGELLGAFFCKFW